MAAHKTAAAAVALSCVEAPAPILLCSTDAYEMPMARSAALAIL